MKPVCNNCGGQGWTQSPHVYDCTQCDMAETRTALEAALRADEAKHGLMDWEDQLLFAYNFKMEKTMSDEKTKPEPAVEGDGPLQTWPKRIWLQWNPDKLEEFPGECEDLTWCADNINASDVEYVRADLAVPVAQPLAPSGAGIATWQERVKAQHPTVAGTDMAVWAKLQCATQEIADLRAALAAQPLAGQDVRAVTDDLEQIKLAASEHGYVLALAGLTTLNECAKYGWHAGEVQQIYERTKDAFESKLSAHAAPSPVNPKQEL